MITLIKESNIMGKLLKYSFYLIIIILLFLIGYSFFGDLSAPQEIITEKIQMPNDTWIYSFNKMSKNNKLIDNFLETIHAERNASKNTLLAYKRDLEAFTRFLSKKRIDLYKANRKDIENYIISLDNHGMSEATRARHLSTIKQIYRYGYDESLIKDNPSNEIKGPKSKRKLPNYLSENDSGA